ncbi:hydrolase [Neotamlana laminarinivorans]|uniref:Hydrolase n=1 Tax=Neotamlana laminarinivorans TaxID=2883124 RepID=A0A9X1L0J9_9FLAO|nr:hydrolase [Tamlana laminarinivorans]MCB4797640.1 hydrolase [Tamlana laminarinivorans]
MKQRIFMYLFVFAVLLIIFQYVNAKRVFEGLNKQNESYKVQVEKYKDSVVKLHHKIKNNTYFSLENNEDALSYFEADGYKVSELLPYIKDKLYETNEVSGEHPLVPYVSGENRKILINTVKFLNHKWLIANFSDGELWGEILVSYFVNEDKTIDFELSESFLYPNY